MLRVPLFCGSRHLWVHMMFSQKKKKITKWWWLRLRLLSPLVGSLWTLWHHQQGSQTVVRAPSYKGLTGTQSQAGSLGAQQGSTESVQEAARMAEWPYEAPSCSTWNARLSPDVSNQQCYTLLHSTRSTFTLRTDFSSIKEDEPACNLTSVFHSPSCPAGTQNLREAHQLEMRLETPSSSKGTEEGFEPVSLHV